MKDASHPVWSILRLTIGLSALVILLWINASNFDITEYKTIVGMFLAFLGSEGVAKVFQNKS